MLAWMTGQKNWELSYELESSGFGHSRHGVLDRRDGLSFWQPAMLALVTLAVGAILNRAGKREMERAYAELIGRFANRFPDTVGQLHPEREPALGSGKDSGQ